MMLAAFISAENAIMQNFVLFVCENIVNTPFMMFRR